MINPKVCYVCLAAVTGPWLLPQRICDLLLLILRSVDEDEPSRLSIWRRLPVLAHLILIIERWQRSFGDANDRLRRLEEQNETLQHSLAVIQGTLHKIVVQNDELQSDVFELHKRLVDLQEDSLLDSQHVLPNQSLSDTDGAESISGVDSIPESSIRVAHGTKANGRPVATTSETNTSTFGRLFKF